MKNLNSSNFLLTLVFVIQSTNLFAQQNQNYIFNSNSGKFLTYSSNTSFCDIVDYVEFLYQKYDNIKLTVNINCQFPIGVDINNVFYKNAIQEICSHNNLSLYKTDLEINISNKNEKVKLHSEIINFDENKQIKISAILFEANLDEMKERGVNWDFILSKNGMEGIGKYNSISENDYNFQFRTASDIYKFSGYTTAMFRFLESEHLGNIVSKMSVVVNDMEKSRMQVGSDISIKQLDFAGNVTDTFFPTGTIINVEPKILIQDSLKFVKLKIHVERSLPFPNELSTEIKKTYTDTEVLLKNKEEMIIGSLLVDEDLVIREGIPILKDLPWWVLGLRYLTGYDSKSIIHKEVVILVSAEILPAIQERIIDNNNLIEERIKSDSNEIKNLIKR